MLDPGYGLRSISFSMHLVNKVREGPAQRAILRRRTVGHQDDEHNVEVKGFGRLGIRTAHFEQTVALFRDVMNLVVVREEHDVVGLRFPDETEMEVWRPSDEFHSFFTTGPVVGFRVVEAEQGRARMEAAGIEFIGAVHHSEGAKWTHFRGPMGTSMRSTARLS
jgi:catechol 2,3-dioxygenase-like lactoylglutathione lyase family enzyme